MKALVIAAATLALAACATTKPTPPEPVVVIQEVKVPVPVPCKVLDAIGPEPTYPDTDAALAAAPNLFARVQLMLQGRLLRMQRLAEYGVVKSSCRIK